MGRRTQERSSSRPGQPSVNDLERREYLAHFNSSSRAAIAVSRGCSIATSTVTLDFAARENPVFVSAPQRGMR